MNLYLDHKAYTSAAQMVAARRALQAKFFPPRSRKMPVDPEEQIVACAEIEPEEEVLPLWRTAPCMFDLHVQEYRSRQTDSAKPVRAYIRKRAAELGFTYEEIVGPSRKRKLVIARHLIMWEIKTIMKPSASLPEIGRMFGDRDHTSALHAVRKIQEMKDRGDID